MPDPFVGLPTVADGGCAYATDIDSPPCGEPVWVHIAVRSPAWGTVSLAACTGHAPIARASGTVLGVHAYLPACETTDCWAGVA